MHCSHHQLHRPHAFFLAFLLSALSHLLLFLLLFFAPPWVISYAPFDPCPQEARSLAPFPGALDRASHGGRNLSPRIALELRLRSQRGDSPSTFSAEQLEQIGEEKGLFAGGDSLEEQMRQLRRRDSLGLKSARGSTRGGARGGLRGREQVQQIDGRKLWKEERAEVEPSLQGDHYPTGLEPELRASSARWEGWRAASLRLEEFLQQVVEQHHAKAKERGSSRELLDDLASELGGRFCSSWGTFVREVAPIESRQGTHSSASKQERAAARGSALAPCFTQLCRSLRGGQSLDEEAQSLLKLLRPNLLPLKTPCRLSWLSSFDARSSSKSSPKGGGELALSLAPSLELVDALLRYYEGSALTCLGSEGKLPRGVERGKRALQAKLRGLSLNWNCSLEEGTYGKKSSLLKQLLPLEPHGGEGSYSPLMQAKLVWLEAGDLKREIFSFWRLYELQQERKKASQGRDADLQASYAEASYTGRSSALLHVVIDLGSWLGSKKGFEGTLSYRRGAFGDLLRELDFLLSHLGGSFSLTYEGCQEMEFALVATRLLAGVVPSHGEVTLLPEEKGLVAILQEGALAGGRGGDFAVRSYCQLEENKARALERGACNRELFALFQREGAALVLDVERELGRDQIQRWDQGRFFLQMLYREAQKQVPSFAGRALLLRRMRQGLEQDLRVGDF